MAFGFYKAVTIQAAQVPSSQSSFPVLLPFTSGDADFATIALGGKSADSGNTGFDIRPYANSGLTSALTYELVANTYNPVTGAFEMWVNVTAANGLIVYVGIGDATLTTDGSSTSTWDSNFTGVWHFPNGTSLTTSDSTGNHNDGTNVSATATTGQVDGGAAATGSLGQITTATAVSGYITASAGTISAWAKPHGSAPAVSFSFNGQFIVGDENGYIGITCANVSSGGDKLYAYNFSTSEASVGTTYTQDVWLKLDWVHDSGNLLLFVNGSSSSMASADTGNLTGKIDFGSSYAGGSIYNGVYDEIRISKIARSANWLTTEYNNQVNLATFWSKGTLTAFVADAGLGPLLFVHASLAGNRTPRNVGY